MAHALARAVRDEEVHAVDATRIIRHQLRLLNTNKKAAILTRSVGAQAVIDRYTQSGEPIPKDSSDDALHADHVFPLTQEALYEVTTLEGWIEELRRLSMVVCLTAKENYTLEQVERTVTGPEKHKIAGLRFTTEDLPWLT